MRVYGRLFDAQGNPLSWVVVQTAPNGDNSEVYLTALIQCLKLNLNESPFYASSGIPARASVAQQVPPDYFVSQIQAAYAQYFANLVIIRTSANPPTYQVNIITKTGAILSQSVAG